MNMKVVYKVVAVLLAISNLLSFSVSAKQLRSELEEKMIKRGYKSEDAFAIDGILIYSDENVPSFVLQKYKELKDWNAVAEHYGVSTSELGHYVQTRKKLEVAFNIPDEIYNQMVESGMTESDCKNFARTAFNGKVDISEAWDAHKKGKTVEDIAQEHVRIKNEIAQATTDFIFEKLSEGEYFQKMNQLAPKMTTEDIWEHVEEKRKGWEKHRINISGITEEEIALGKDAGITNIFDLCRAKLFEKFTNLSFRNLIMQMKEKISPFAEIIQKNLNLDKIEKMRDGVK